MVFIQILLLVLLFLVGFLSLTYYFRDHQYYSTTRRKLITWIKLSSPRSSDKILNPPAENNSINSRTAADAGSCGGGDNGEDGKRDEGRGDDDDDDDDDDGDGEIMKVFQTFDKNGDGYITRQELEETLKKMGISTSEEEVRQMIDRLDSNGDGLIELSDFSGLFSGNNQAKKEDGHGKTILQSRITQASSAGDLRDAFDVFDGDGDGLISVEELGLVLTTLGMTQGSRVEICKQMINKVDLDGDGMVNFEEFRRMMMT